jgi:hypothetical protein
MSQDNIKSRKQDLTVRLEGIRDSYRQSLSDITAEVAFNGTEWSVVDLLRHVTAVYYPNQATSMLEEDSPDLTTPAFDLSVAWQRSTDRIMEQINDALFMATDLSLDQLQRTGTRAGNTIVVIGVLEGWAVHFEEHLKQLQEEIRPREGLA